MISSLDPKLVFEVIRDEFGSLRARCLNARISTVGADLTELCDNLATAVEDHYSEEEAPGAGDIHLMFAGDEALPPG